MGKELNVYTCVDFTGHYPVGQAAVVVAEDPDKAEVLLKKALKKVGLDQGGDALNMVQLPLGRSKVVILMDGNY